MKTFTEACNAVLCRELSSPNESCKDMDEASERYHSMLQEVQNDDLTAVAVAGFADVGLRHGLPIAALLAVAFSHGVMVGYEMGKPDVEAEFGEREHDQEEETGPKGQGEA